MISIKNDLETVYVSLEYELNKTNQSILIKSKELIYQAVTVQYTQRFMKNQRRINALKSPFKKVKAALQEILGENIESVVLDEVIDTTQLDDEKKKSLDILQDLSYPECLSYLQAVNKHGLKKANAIWHNFIN